ncbi:hypothetical protein GmHk_04G009097 [Glycine max]|nr:hypothetical protein GmHk_04G009097 [Glycine max]
MTRCKDFIRDIDNIKDTLKLEVRIIEPWFVESKDKSKQAEIIIMDENVVLFNFLMLLIDFKNNTYKMHNFKIVNNESRCKLCLHSYKLIFTSVVVVIKQDLRNTPLKTYDFINFANILARTYRHNLLVVVKLLPILLGITPVYNW